MMIRTIAFIRFIRLLSNDKTERRVIAYALIYLLKRRKNLIKLLLPIVRLFPESRNLKFEFWRSIILSLLDNKLITSKKQDLLVYLKSTHAYLLASEKIQRSLNSCFSRGLNYRLILFQLKQDLPRRLFVFHHYDSRGFFPNSWIRVLKAIKDSGWMIIVSSSGINKQTTSRLEEMGIFIALRLNIGLCLGAYKDLSMIIEHDHRVASNITSLILCNDSTIPVLDESCVVNQLNTLVSQNETSSIPTLAGLTDSAEREAYHLQSYFLYANSACLESIFWQNFWLKFNPYQVKDKLIDEGEIALSQKALSHGFMLKAVFPLIDSLFFHKSMTKELRLLGFSKPSEINQTLFSWKNLLEKGFPLVKKQVIFDMKNSSENNFNINQLHGFIPPDRNELILNDLHEIFKSRNFLSSSGDLK